MNKHIKQSVVLFAASALSVVLGVVTSVFNTSMLSPSEYGDVRYVNNILNFVASLLLFGYFVSGSRMLALSKDENRSRQIRGVMVVILLVASLVLAISMVVCYYIHREWLNPNVRPSVAFTGGAIGGHVGVVILCRPSCIFHEFVDQRM